MNNSITFKALIVSTILTMAPIIAQAAPQAAKPTKPAPAAKEGILDGGGGSSIQGKSIDSYARRVDQIKGYDLVVKPVLESIKNTVPELYERLNKRIRLSGFYVIPNKILIQLPAHKQGIPFGISDIEQTAYNINSEVWFDDTSLSKQSENDAGALLLHEIFMLDWIAMRDYKTINWPALHSSVRKIGNYFRLYSGEDENTVAEMANAFYGNNTEWTMFKTKTQYDKSLAQAAADREEYRQMLEGYSASIASEIAAVCTAIPRTENIPLMNESQMISLLPAFQKLAELVHVKSLWLAKSAEMNSSVNGRFVKDALEAKFFKNLNTSGFGDYRNSTKYFTLTKKKLTYELSYVKSMAESLSEVCHLK